MKLDRIEIIDYLADNHEDDEWLADDEGQFNKQVDDLERELDAAISDRIGEWIAAREAGRPLGPLVDQGLLHWQDDSAQQEADHIREVERDRQMVG